MLHSSDHLSNLLTDEIIIHLTHISELVNYLQLLYFMQKSESFIKTFIRIRPPESEAIYRERTDERILNCCDKTYKFSHVFKPQATDQEIFEKIGFQLIDNTLNGYNSSLFAYGQTGTGKTYTMTGNSSKEGLVQRSVSLLIRKLKNQNKFEYFSLKISYIEIYNETIRDLLSQKESKIMIRELSKSGFYVQGLEAVEISDDEGFSKELRRGLLKRSTKSTKMNEVSSRSHTIMTVILQTKKLDDEKGLLVRISKLNFVDLAGSEKQKQTEVSGCELKQASSINKSLTTLSLVISKLCEKQTKNSHVPYRESILTKVLKDSIGGNSMTTFIGMISSQKAWASETISTLLFLQRLKNVRNIVEVNEKIEGKEEELVKKIKGLQEKIMELQLHIENITKQHSDCQFKLNQSQIQIKQLQERLMYSGQMNTFFGNFQEQQEDTEIFAPSPCEQNRTQSGGASTPRLPIIQETSQSSSIGSNKKKVCFLSQVKKMPNAKQELQQNLSLKKSPKKNAKNFWQMENEFLREQIQKYGQQDEGYINFIELIAGNISKLQFDQAQILILEAQTERLNNVQSHLEAYRSKFEQLLIFSEKEQAQIKTQLFEVRSLELDNISKRSIFISNENRLKQEIEMFFSREKELNERICNLEGTFKIQIFKLEKDNLDLQENFNKLENQAQLLKLENAKLYEILSLYKKETKVVDFTINFPHQRKESSSQDEYIDQISSQNERLKLKVGQLEQMIENDFMLSFEEMEKELKGVKEINCSLMQQHNLYLNDIECLRSQLSSIQEKFHEVENERTHLLESCNLSQQEVLFEVDGQEITFGQLMKRYQWLCEQKQKDQQSKEQLESKLKQLNEELSLEQSKLQSQRQGNKQSQTYFRYELKVKNIEISKLKYERNRVEKEAEENMKKYSNHDELAEQLQFQISDRNRTIELYESVKEVNEELQKKIRYITAQATERENQYITQIKLYLENHDKEKSQFRQTIKGLKQEKTILQQKFAVLNSNFNQCLKRLQKSIQDYRSQEFYFYRFKKEYERTVEMLKNENQRLMKVARVI